MNACDFFFEATAACAGLHQVIPRQVLAPHCFNLHVPTKSEERLGGHEKHDAKEDPGFLDLMF